MKKILFMLFTLAISFEVFAQTEFGIGVPPVTFGVNETPPSAPAQWPSGAKTNFYYIDNTDPSSSDGDNPFGYPDLPRKTIPDGTLDAGSYIEIHGGPYEPSSELAFQANGTFENPVWVRGASAAARPVIRQRISLAGSYLVVENLKFTESRKTITVKAGAHDVSIRNNLLSGPGVFDGHTSAIGIRGTSSAISNNIVIYRNEIRNFGDVSPQSPENDYHGIKGSTYCQNVWVIENDIHDMSGDSIQIGDASMPDAERCRRIFIAENDFYNNRENAVDIKNSQDVIISGNRMHGFAASGPSQGYALVVHDGADSVWIIGNTIFDSHVGIINTGGTNVWAIANVIRDIFEAGSGFELTSLYGFGVGVHFRGTSSGGVVNNTFLRYSKGIQIAGGSNYSIVGNIFANRRLPESFDLMVRTTSLAASVDSHHNLFSDFAGTVSSSQFRDIAQILSRYELEAESIVSDPILSDSDNSTYTLANVSPAIDSGTESFAYQLFADRFGVPIRFDIDKKNRPANGAWDIGASEFGTSIRPRPVTDLRVQ